MRIKVQPRAEALQAREAPDSAGALPGPHRLRKRGTEVEAVFSARKEVLPVTASLLSDNVPEDTSNLFKAAAPPRRDTRNRLWAEGHPYRPALNPGNSAIQAREVRAFRLLPDIPNLPSVRGNLHRVDPVPADIRNRRQAMSHDRARALPVVTQNRHHLPNRANLPVVPGSIGRP